MEVGSIDRQIEREHRRYGSQPRHTTHCAVIRLTVPTVVVCKYSPRRSLRVHRAAPGVGCRAKLWGAGAVLALAAGLPSPSSNRWDLEAVCLRAVAVPHLRLECAFSTPETVQASARSCVGGIDHRELTIPAPALRQAGRGDHKLSEDSRRAGPHLLRTGQARSFRRRLQCTIV